MIFTSCNVSVIRKVVLGYTKLDFCKRLVKKYPVLRDSCGNGYVKWSIDSMSNLKMDNSLTITLYCVGIMEATIAKKVEEPETPKSCK